MDSFGKRLKMLRGSANGTAFAERIGINRQTLYRYERGDRVPLLDFAEKLSTITGASVEWLISGTGTPPSCLRIPSAGDSAPVAAVPDGSTSIEDQLARLKRAAGVGTDTAFAARLGITQGGISSAKKRGRLPDKWFVKISKECGVPLDWLITGRESDAAAEPAGQSPARHAARAREVIVVGLASCGTSGWYNPGPLALRVPMPVDYPADSDIIAVIAIGTSMNPDGIREGNLVFCDPAVTPEPGDAVYIEQTNGTASIKRFLRQDLEWIYLQGWGKPDEHGQQKPYTERFTHEAVLRIACVVVVKRKA